MRLAAPFLLGSCALLLVGVAGLGAEEIPTLRTEQEARLNDIQPKIFDLMEKIHAAEFDGKPEEAKQLREQLGKLKREKIQLLGAMGELPD